jgi:hypothetical protein
MICRNYGGSKSRRQVSVFELGLGRFMMDMAGRVVPCSADAMASGVTGKTGSKLGGRGAVALPGTLYRQLLVHPISESVFHSRVALRF